jgi:heme/copper-type cytochrome/quinol oxidase subunit 1
MQKQVGNSNLIEWLLKKSNNAIYNFAVRWLFSTNHKDIGTLLLIFAAISGLAGTALSLYKITLESQFKFFSYNYHLYNVIVTGHAFLMILLSDARINWFW